MNKEKAEEIRGSGFFLLSVCYLHHGGFDKSSRTSFFRFHGKSYTPRQTHRLC